MSHNDQVDAVHAAMAVLEDACTHPTLNMAFEILPFPGGRVYWCSDCRKKIFIPNFTLLEDSQARLAGIIGLTFGEQWGEAARRGQI